MGWDKFQPPSQGSAEENEWMNGNNTYLHQGEQNKRKRKEKKNIKAFKNINTTNISNRTKFELFFLMFYTSGKEHNQLEYIALRDKYRFPL